MAIYYSYLSSLLFLLLITDWVNTASLRSYLYSTSNRSLNHHNSSIVVNKKLTTSESILIRRRPLLSSSDRRQKRWTKEEDNDEVEIPIDENIHEQSISTTNTIDTPTTVFENKENDIFSLNSTLITEQSNINSTQAILDENMNVTSILNETSYPLLRQDSFEINENNQLTTVSVNDQNIQSTQIDTEQEATENPNHVTSINNLLPLTASNENIDINSTELEIGSTNVTDINQVISNEKNQSISNTIDNLTTSEIIKTDVVTSINSPQVEVSTITELDSDTTIVSEETNNIQTSIDSITSFVLEHNTTMINVPKDTTIIFHDTQNETTSIVQKVTTAANIADVSVTGEELGDTTTLSETSSDDISTMTTDENEAINSLPQTTPKPICDFSCQCSKKCPYGYEVNDGQCECDPPCKNYKCYGDDVCNVTSEGKPLCQPSNGSEHDRPIRCYQPRDEGYHDVNIRYHDRWYYDPNTDECHLFLYRGLGGNENNFLTLHKCNLECITCALEPDRGPCLGHLSMWHYDFKKNMCLQFAYSGCKGNENKFIRKQDCVDTCITRILNI